MTYGELIERYLEGSMDAAERLVFEHELEDNARLRSEWEAWTLSGTMIQVLAQDAAPADGISGFGMGSSKALWKMGISVLLLVLIALLWLWNIRHGDSAKESAPLVEDQVLHIAEAVPSVLKEEETSEAVELTPAPEKSISITTPSKVTGVSSFRKKESVTRLEAGLPLLLPMDKAFELLAAERVHSGSGQDMVILDRQLEEGSNLTLKARKGIVLKPGFIAAAGTQFHAKVELVKD